MFHETEGVPINEIQENLIADLWEKWVNFWFIKHNFENLSFKNKFLYLRYSRKQGISFNGLQYNYITYKFILKPLFYE